MKRRHLLIWTRCLFILSLVLGQGVQAAPVAFSQSIGSQVASIVKVLLVKSHYAKKPFDDAVSKEFFENYLKSLDPSKTVFLKSDIDQFKVHYETRLDDYIGAQDLEPLNVIFSAFLKRSQEYHDLAQEILGAEEITKTYDALKADASNPSPLLLKAFETLQADAVASAFKEIEKTATEPKSIQTQAALKKLQSLFDFTAEESIVIDRSKAEWPLNVTQQREEIRKSIKLELLNSLIAGESPIETVRTLYNRENKRLKKLQEIAFPEKLEGFLNALTVLYDPHTQYFTPVAQESFEAAAQGEFYGIGARLDKEGEYIVISSILLGTPAALSHQLSEGDRIVAIAQGSAAPVDVVGMETADAVKLIRGARGSEVRLTILSPTSPDKKVVSLIRERVQIAEQKAKARILEVSSTADGKTKKTKIGIIDLPGFYGDYSGKDDPKKSCGNDVFLLIEKFRIEKVSAMILDLRNNGGGLINEAVDIVDHFIAQGPVVQVKDSEGDLNTYKAEDPQTFYAGPLLVLVNEHSASASEIVAAALQDLDRAVIVGTERTHGKGTVQIVRPLGADLGELKVTQFKFYRSSGDTTQVKGVRPDIILRPALDQGEQGLPHHLEADRIKALPRGKGGFVSFYLDELRKLAAPRIEKNQEFQFIAEDLKEAAEKKSDNTLSLRLATRQAEKEVQKSRTQERAQKRKDAPPGISVDEKYFRVDDSGKIIEETPHKPNLSRLTEAQRQQYTESLQSKQALSDAELSEAISILVDYEKLFNPGRE